MQTLLSHIGRTLVTGVVACLLAACGGGGDSPPPMIDAAGGTVSSSSGAAVVVPPNALATPAAITITPSGAGAPALPVTLTSVGTMHAFTPHGQAFALPVTMTVPIDPALVPAGATVRLYKTANGIAGPWEEVAGATRNGNLISGQVTSFSVAGAFVFGNAPPNITQQPVARSVVAPQTASFSTTFDGTPGFDVQWQRSDDGGANWSNAGALQTLTTSPATSTFTTGATSVVGDDGALFRALISNVATLANAPVISATASLTVAASVVAPTITTQPQSVSGAIGNVTFSVVATGTNLVYQWRKDGTPIAGATSASLNLANVQAGDAGGYTVVVSNFVNGAAINSVTSSVATLTVTPPPASNVARIAAGSDFSFALRANGDLHSWGSDSAGTLGAGNGDQTRSVPGFVATSNITGVAAGGAHGIAVRGTGEVRGWGYNMWGQLGDGGGQSREGPVGATVDAAGTTQFSDAVEVCGGSLHSLVRRSGGSVRAMGANASGQIGDGSNSDRPRSVAVSGISNAIAIACRGNHSLALLADGTVRAWGSNSAGQLGDGTTTNRNTPVVVSGLTGVIAIAAGTDHSLALRNDGSVWAWGSNVNGKLGDGTEINRLTPRATLLTAQITAIAAGYMNSLARRSDGIVLSWGINETGQLGSGSLSPGFRPQPAPVTGLTNVVDIAMGTGGLSHALAVRSDGTVWAWGDNGSGKLGNGSTALFSATPVQVTGLNLN